MYMTSQDNPRVKLDEIKSVYAVGKEIDVICFTETWLHAQVENDLIKLEGYKEPYRRDRTANRYGGVCAYVSDNIMSQRRMNLEPAGIELLWLELKVQLKKVMLGICYRAPRQTLAEATEFLEELQESIVNVIAHGCESIILLGDLNDTCTKWDSIHVTSELKNGLFDMVNLFDMTQLVHEPTYITDNVANILDIVITDSPGYVKKVSVLPPVGSKHAVVQVDFNITYPRDKNYTRHVWDYGKGDYVRLNAAISRHPWEDILHAND
jgi:hypothetical protein